MRAFIVWVSLLAVSVTLGLVLYSTSLSGSMTGYQERPAAPQPTATVVKTKIKKKVIRKPAKKKVVYVPQAAQPAAAYTPAPARTYAPAPAPVYTPAPAPQRKSVATSKRSSDDDHDDHDHDDDDHDDD